MPVDTAYESFKSFMFSSNMAKTSASYAIGAATADFAKTITFSLLIPCIQMAWAGVMARKSTAAKSLDFSLVVEHLLYWFCVIFVAYVLSELFFSQGLLGIKTTLDDKDKQRLEVSEHKADEAKEAVVNAAKTLVTGEDTGKFAPVV
jgi:large-conductance mechanosensitive channel